MTDIQLKHILCIDDDEDILFVTQMCLETVANLKVTCCNDSFKAIELALAAKPDLILLDVMMPQKDGPSLLKDLRQNLEIASIPVIFMTAKIQPLEVEKYLALGASGVIAKPFDPINLADQIKEIWEKCYG